MKPGVTRREVLIEIVWASMGASLVSLGGLGCRPRSAAPAQGFFTAAELATLAAACERILPRDDDPGAIDLGVPAYIDQALTDEIMVNWREPMRRGLADLEAQAQARGGVGFAALADGGQDELLADLAEASRAPTGFFQRLLHLTFEGAFGDPAHGGNRDGLGWKLVGFTPDPCRPATLAKLGRRR